MPGSRPRPLDGYFLEDYAPGDRLVHATPRTLTAADASLYLALTGSRNPVHCAAPLARAMGHPSAPLDDLLVFHVAFGKTVHDVSFNAVANLGYADVRFLEPVYAGDFNEVIRLFHDEKAVREAAFAAECRAVESGILALDRQLFFQTRSHYADFAEFDARMIQVTHTNHRLSPDLYAQVRQAFEAHLSPEGATFYPPQRVDVLKKPG